MELPTITGEPRDGNIDPGVRETGRREQVTHLRLRCSFQVGDKDPDHVSAFINIKAVVSLVRKGLVDSEYLQSSCIPLRFLTANNQMVEGGTLESYPLLKSMQPRAGVMKLCGTSF